MIVREIMYTLENIIDKYLILTPQPPAVAGNNFSKDRHYKSIYFYVYMYRF